MEVGLEKIKKNQKKIKKTIDKRFLASIIISVEGTESPEAERTKKEMEKKYELIVEWLEGCKFTHSEAIAEANGMIRRLTTGLDAISKEAAIDEIYYDIFED